MKSSDNNEQSDPTAVQYFTAFGKRWGTRLTDFAIANNRVLTAL